ncbi:MAG: heavy metal response regulator transcription factor [Archangium sp.]|nr:heavy metal response regulator transcription factor [Archangium sp.]
MKVFVVEDELKTASFLRAGLGESGFTVDVAADGVEACRRAASGSWDCIILDVMLPRRDGWAVLSEIRANGVQTPVLMLTACDGVDERVKGLELGADDYLVKPFSFSELLARVRTLLRRGRPLPTSLRIADLQIDFGSQRVSRRGARLDLTAREFSLLSLLARHTGEVLSRALIADQVWGMNFESGTNVVDVAIHRLRAKVDDWEPPLIHCWRGRGYVLEQRSP